MHMYKHINKTLKSLLGICRHMYSQIYTGRYIQKHTYIQKETDTTKFIPISKDGKTYTQYVSTYAHIKAHTDMLMKFIKRRYTQKQEHILEHIDRR